MNLKHTDLTLNEFEECLENIQSQKFKYIKMTENSTVKTSTTFLWKYQIIKQKKMFLMMKYKKKQLSKCGLTKNYMKIFLIIQR